MNDFCLVAIAVMLTLASSGCAFQGKPTRVVLKHPETYDFVSCVVDKWETAGSYENNDKCVEDYKKKGYLVWGKR